MTNVFSRRNWVYLILAGVFLWLLYTYRLVVGPLVIAVLLAYLLNPAVTLLSTKARLSHNAAVGAVYGVFLLILISVLVLVVPQVIRQSSFLSAELAQVQIEVAELQPALESLLGFEAPLDPLLADAGEKAIEALQPEKIFRVLLASTTNLVWVLVILVAAYYLLKDWAVLREWLYSLAPADLEPDLRELQIEIKLVWSAYLRGQLLLMLIVGSLSGLAAAAVGLRGAIVLGLLAGGLVIVPSVGPAIATVIAALVAWTQGSNFLDISNLWLAALVVGLFSGVQLIEGVFLQPQIMGRRLNLHPALIFIAILSTLTLVGALATLIIIPLLGTVEIILRYIRRRM